MKRCPPPPRAESPSNYCPPGLPTLFTGFLRCKIEITILWPHRITAISTQVIYVNHIMQVLLQIVLKKHLLLSANSFKKCLKQTSQRHKITHFKVNDSVAFGHSQCSAATSSSSSTAFSSLQNKTHARYAVKPPPPPPAPDGQQSAICL